MLSFDRNIGPAIAYLRDKHLERWLPCYLRHRLERLMMPPVAGLRHLLVAVCDHFEPLWHPANDWQSVPHELGMDRVRRWVERYPELAASYRDGDGHTPRHTFFFPGEQYHPEFLAPLAWIAAQQLGEVELHLHHDGDTASSLREAILGALEHFASHGHLAREASGLARYAFIHGDWALANARRDGRHCGVDSELAVLHETGCYADFTFPAAPSECQPPICNQIYWPVGDLARRRAHEVGERARVGRTYDDRILLIQGPLALTPRLRKMPLQLENGDLTDAFPADPVRVRTWVEQHVHIADRPDWTFVKLHTHGAPDPTAASLLGPGGHALHRELTSRFNDGIRWKLHYVTAREMYNIAIAAMQGQSGDPGQYRDHVLAAPPAAKRRGAGNG